MKKTRGVFNSLPQESISELIQTPSNFIEENHLSARRVLDYGMGGIVFVIKRQK